MNKSNVETFGDFIFTKRKEKQYSLRYVADLLGISAPYLSDVEKGFRNSLALDKLMLLKDLFGLSNDDYNHLLNLAGKQRNDVPPDLIDYIINRDYVSNAIRLAIKLGATEEDWNSFVEYLTKSK